MVEKSSKNPIVNLSRRITELKEPVIESMQLPRSRNTSKDTLLRMESIAAELADLSTLKDSVISRFPTELAQKREKELFKQIEKCAAELTDLQEATVNDSSYQKAILELVFEGWGNGFSGYEELKRKVAERLDPIMSDGDKLLYQSAFHESLSSLEMRNYIISGGTGGYLKITEAGKTLLEKLREKSLQLLEKEQEEHSVTKA